MPILASRFFVGGSLTPVVHRLGSAPTDLGVVIPARWQSVRLTLGGEGGEAIFTALYPVVSYNAACTLAFTPIVDETVYDGTDGPNAVVSVSLTAPTDSRLVRYEEELGLSQPYVRSGVEYGRYALRGRSFQLRVEVTAAIGNDADGNPGIVRWHGVELKYEVVGRTRTAVPSPSYP